MSPDVGDRVLFASSDPNARGKVFGRVVEVIGTEDDTVYLIKPEVLTEGSEADKVFAAWDDELTVVTP